MNKIIVLIPHYNNPAGLLNAVASIGEQEQVDVLVVDDGSKSLFAEADIKKAFRANGEVYYQYLEQNQGIETALNTGLSFSKEKGYAYVARLDCDDLCHKERFKMQAALLEANPDIYLVGSYVEAISPQGNYLYTIKPPTTHEDIKNKMYFNSMFIHPTVLFRTKAIDTLGYYPTTYEAAEDYAYFFRFVQKFKTAIIPECLVKIQIDNTGISAKKRAQQVKSRMRIIRENFYFGYFPLAGLLRNYIILKTPRALLTRLKVLFFKK